MKDAKIELHDKALVRRAFSVKEVALILGISERSVRRLIARGLLKPCRALRHVRIPSEQVDELLKE